MYAPQPTADLQPTLKDICADALKQHNGNIDEATAAVVKMLRADRALFYTIIESAVRAGVEAGARYAFGAERRHTLRVVERELQAPRGDVDAIIGAVKATLMDFWVWSGVRLSSATRPQVQAKSTEYQLSTNRTGHLARWLALIAKEIPDDDTRVGDALSEKRVRELYTQAEGTC